MTDGETALAELKEISSQVEAAVLVADGGAVVASTLPEDRAQQLAQSAQALFEEAGRARGGELTHVEAATGEGSLFAVRDGKLLIAATTGPEPTSGLVFYDLKSCLRKATAKPKPKPRAKPKTRAKPKNKASGNP